MPHTQAQINKKMIAPKLRFKGFVQDWKKVNYEDIYSFYTTNSFSRDKLNYEKGFVKNIHYGDIHTKFANLFDITKEQVPFINSDVDIRSIKEECYCQEGDLVIADASEDYADIGKSIEIININNQKLIAGLHTFLARPNKGKRAKGFAGYLVQNWNFRKQVMTIAQGTKVLSLSTSRLGLLKLNFPSLPEQQKIASFLSSIDEKIQQLTRKKELLEQYKKGVMQQLFSGKLRFKDEKAKAFPEWEEKRLGEVCDVKGGKRMPFGYSLIEENNGYPYITVSDIENGTVSLSKIKYVPSGAIDLIKNYKISVNDIFISVAGTLGLVGIIPKTLDQANLTENCNKLTNLKCDQTYLLQFLKTDRLTKLIQNISTKGAQPKLAIYAIISLPIPIPTIQEQKKIAEYLSSLDTKIETITNQITQTQTFKKGLLQQMFV